MNVHIFANLLRALFPKWNFFDQIAYSIELEFKVPGANEWTPVSFRQTRQFLSLFLNTETNLALAHINILEHFAEDIQVLKAHDPMIHSSDVQRLTTFKMVKSLLQIKLQDFELPSQTVQFKVLARNPDDVVDLYVSDWIQLEHA